MNCLVDGNEFRRLSFRTKNTLDAEGAEKGRRGRGEGFQARHSGGDCQTTG
jgi:hypothetical protein